MIESDGLWHARLDEGVTGFVVDDEEQAVQAVKRLGEIDRGRVRERFEKRFTAGRMAADYVSHYQSVMNGGGPGRLNESSRRERIIRHGARTNFDSRRFKI
jgi:hypothetical protein